MFCTMRKVLASGNWGKNGTQEGFTQGPGQKLLEAARRAGTAEAAEGRRDKEL